MVTQWRRWTLLTSTTAICGAVVGAVLVKNFLFGGNERFIKKLRELGKSPSDQEIKK